ncbi:hypothetical protein [Mycoplasmopsis gallinarum]|uniref:hypothetical protein n=1 Tax=Mycoplasmopsis gallinarum TaxID=29557 RepID=UPI000684FFB2|nr:hypothetical protein [Mycoplasmopsis gallinarum]
MKKKKIQLKVNNDDEWYTLKEDIQFFIDNANISKDKIIWCPFDWENSNFVTQFRKNGYTVIASHIEDGKDFYQYEPEKWDILISNPPYRNKSKLMRRMWDFGKDRPFALLMTTTCLQSKNFINWWLEYFNNPQIVLMEHNRIRFTKDHLNYDLDKVNRGMFGAIWICNNLFDKDINWWKGNDYKLWKAENYAVDEWLKLNHKWDLNEKAN